MWNVICGYRCCRPHLSKSHHIVQHNHLGHSNISPCIYILPPRNSVRHILNISWHLPSESTISYDVCNCTNTTHRYKPKNAISNYRYNHLKSHTHVVHRFTRNIIKLLHICNIQNYISLGRTSAPSLYTSITIGITPNRGHRTHTSSQNPTLATPVGSSKQSR